MPRIPTFHVALGAALVLALSAGCASIALPKPSWPTFASTTSRPGTKQWWDKNKNKAELVPGEGFRVAGADGYFDEEGRPIGARVAKIVNQKESRGILGDVRLTGAVSGIKEQVGLGPDQERARQALADGEDLFRREDYDGAAKRFKEAIARWPDSQIEQDAMFQLAESYFFAERYPKAVDAYEALIQKYPNTLHLDKNIQRQFKLAQYWEGYQEYNPNWATTPNFFDKRRPFFDTQGRAMKIYENIRLNDPTGPLADDAIMATATSYFRRGRYADADQYYDLLRKEYPRSEHQYEAHILGLQCKRQKYQGPDYDGAVLEEAEKLVKQLKVQFAGELNDDQRTRLREDEAWVAQQIALRDFDRAEYHEDKKEYGAAKLYFAEIVNKYPQSELGAKARERLAALGDKPDRPDVPLKRLVDLVPQSAERTAIAQVPLVDESVRTASAIDDDSSAGPNQNSGQDGQTIQR